MKKKTTILALLCFFFWSTLCSQTNEIAISAVFNNLENTLQIRQEILFFNKTNTPLDTIYLHNWPNSYKDKHTPLSRRFIENYSKSFFFAKNDHRGWTNIHNISIDMNPANWSIEKKNPDIVRIVLDAPLNPRESTKIFATYTVKFPRDKFTGYGRNKIEFNLRYWYLVPAVHQEKWLLMNNLDMDDLIVDFTNYKINITMPDNFYLNSDLEAIAFTKNHITTYHLSGKNRLNVELNIELFKTFETIPTPETTVITNLTTRLLTSSIKKAVLDRELKFIKSYLGEYPHKKILINKIEYNKNPVYGLNQLPDFLSPFPDIFEWDIKHFKVLSKKYIENIMITHKREDAWITDGIQTFLMMKYVEKFYPEINAMGNVSKFWGIRNYHLSKVNFNTKYPLVYQFIARKNFDQAITTRTDLLSNFNRKIGNKYKAGLGLKYLDEYIGDSIIPKAIKQFYSENHLKSASSTQFNKIVKKNTSKDLNWFFTDYLNTKRKIDYTITKTKKTEDSIEVTIKNKRKFSAPIPLYTVDENSIVNKQWLTGIDSVHTIKIPKKGVHKIALNYENISPELNVRDNWKNLNNKIFNRPLQVRFLKDLEDPYYNQIFYAPTFRYNYYDGLTLGFALSNKTILKKRLLYKATPSYSTKSNSFTGSFSAFYEYLPENSKVLSYQLGVIGSNFHYAPDLAYKIFTPFAMMKFKRKSLRDVGGSAIAANLVMVDREINETQTLNNEANRYNVFSLTYAYSKPEIIDDFRYFFNYQTEQRFNKLSFDIRYRKLTDTNRQFDFRVFVGAFINNKTKDNYFSYALDRPANYLFQYDYLGNSEKKGFFSQQIIINEGGFKSKLPIATANRWMATFNASVGLWRWVEIYGDIGFVKNKGDAVYFAHDGGVRLNFVHNILELYFPLHSNLGWEITQANYSSKIRFVLTLKPKAIINFFRRGFI